MRAQTIAAVLALAALACGAPAASAAPLADLTALDLAADGSVELHGRMAALRTLPVSGDEVLPGANPAPPTVEQLTVSGPSVRVEADVAQANGTVVSSTEEMREDWDATTYTGATLRLGAIRPGVSIFLTGLEGHPAPEVRLQATELQLKDSPAASVGQERFVATRQNPREPLQADLSQAAQLPSAQWTSLSVEGAFAITVWELDLQVTSDRGSATEWSGDRYDELVPVDGLPVPAYGRLTSRQVYVFVESGSASIEFAPGTNMELYLVPVGAQIEGLATFHGARGILQTAEGEQELRSDDLKVEGRLDLGLAPPAAGRLPVRLGGDVDQASLSGSQVVLRGTPGGQGFSVPQGLLALVALAAAGVGGAWMRRRTQDRRLERLEDAMESGSYETVAAQAGRLRRDRRHGHAARVMQVVSLLRLGKPAEARRALESRPDWPAAERPVQDFLLAHLLCLEGRAREARQALRRCLRSAPDLRPEALGNPVLRSILEPAMREGYS